MKSLHTLSLLTAAVLAAPLAHAGKPSGGISHFAPVGTNFKPAGEVEALAATLNGKTVIYTDAENGNIGFVDISDPANPEDYPSLAVGGTPTSIAVVNGRYAIAVVDEGYDAATNQYSGSAVVIDLRDPAAASIARVIPLGGQPDSIAVSPNRRYAAITIENERLEDGPLGETPAGFLAIIDLKGSPASWTTRNVSLSGFADISPEDPEPEVVAINKANKAAVTLQENNHVVVVDLRSGTVVSDFSAGQVVDQSADLTDDDQVSFTESLTAVREPDGIAWTPEGNIVTANEGDTDDMGSRNITIFSPTGEVLFDPGASLEMLAAEEGLYDDSRSDNSGAEFNTVKVGRFGKHTYIFATAEKFNLVAVYRLGRNETTPELVQVLPTGDEPEGLVVIPNRKLVVTANEDDDTLSIFAGQKGGLE